MATVSERSRELATKAVFSADGNHVKTFDADSLSELIEQALLAERQDVWTTAIKAIKGYKSLSGLNRSIAITALRAAAEKEGL